VSDVGLAGVGHRIDTLFYEIDAHTSGFAKGMDESKTKLTDFITYAKGNPAIVLAGLGAAFIAVGIHATHMAAEIDDSLRSVQKSFPLTQQGLDQLRGTLEELSRVTPRSQAELAGAMEAIAARGVTSIEEMQLRLRKAVDIADASGADLKSVIDGLDNIADAFKLSAGEAADELTRIFAAAQGKVPLEEVFAVMERGGSVLASLGIKAHEAGEAMVALIDAGIPRRQAGIVLQNILDAKAQAEKVMVSGTEEQKKAAQIVVDNLSATSISANGFAKSLANLGESAVKSNVSLRDVGISTTELNAINRVGEAAMRDHRTEAEKFNDALKKMQDAAQVGREGAGALNQFLKNELNAVLIDLGNVILPTVLQGLKDMKSILDTLHAPSGLADEIKLIEAQERLENARKGLSRVGISESHTLSFMPDFNEGKLSSQQLGQLGTAQIDYLKAAQDVSVFTDNLTRAAQARQADRAAARLAATDKKKFDEDEAQREKDRQAAERAAVALEQTKMMVASLRIEAIQSRAQSTKTLVDDAEAQVEAFEKKIKDITDKHGAVPAEATEELQRLRANVDVVRKKEAFATGDRLNAIVDESTVTNVDNLTHALEQLKRELLEVPGVTQTDIDKITQLKQAVIDATQASEDAANAAGLVNVDSATNGIQKMKQLLTIQDTLTAAQAKTKFGTAEWKIYDDAIKGVIVRIKQLQDANAGLSDPAAEATQKVREMAQAIQQGVDGAIQLAEAFGLVDANTAKLLRSIGQMATQIPVLLDSIKVMQAGGSMLGVLGAALPVAGALASIGSALFGKSPEEAERQRLLKENNVNLRNLTDKVGDLARINVTGVELQKYSNFLADTRLKAIGPQQGLQGILADPVNRQIGAILDSLHLTADGLKEFAKQFGVTVGTGGGGKITLEDLQNLRDAMAQAEITQFADTFSGQMAQMQAAINLFSVKDPVKQLELFRKALDGIAGGGGALGKAIDAFDLSTAEGVDAAKKALQDLFAQMQAGTLTAAQLGGLTPQEFLDAIQKTLDLINAGGGDAASGTGGFNVDRTITEVSASRIGALLDVANSWAEETAHNTALTAALLGGGALPVFGAPAVASLGAVSGDLYITVDLNLPPGTIIRDATAFGRGVGEALSKELSQQLGRDARWKQKARGENVLTG
jgi:hypothetical protein